MTVRLVFVDHGEYHTETLGIPAEVLDRYERLIDCLREDEGVLKRIYIDLDRLCSARVVSADDPA